MECLHDWWRYRKEELLALVKKECPLYVYNEESINDTLFDLLAVDAIDDLFYPVHENPHPRILRKVFELGADFKCISSVELDHLLRLFPILTPKRIFLKGVTNIVPISKAKPVELLLKILSDRYFTFPPMEKRSVNFFA